MGKQSTDYFCVQYTWSLVWSVSYSSWLGSALAGMAHFLFPRSYLWLYGWSDYCTSVDTLEPEAAYIQKQITGAKRDKIRASLSYHSVLPEFLGHHGDQSSKKDWSHAGVLSLNKSQQAIWYPLFKGESFNGTLSLWKWSHGMIQIVDPSWFKSPQFKLWTFRRKKHLFCNSALQLDVIILEYQMQWQKD